MKFRNCGLILVLGLIAAPALAAPEPGAKPMPLRRPVTIMLDLDASGKASNFRCLPPISEGVCAALIKAAGHWQFSPGMTKNVATAMTAHIALAMQATKTEGGYELQATKATVSQIVRAANAPASPVPVLAPPQYPTHALRRGMVGNVVLELWPDRITKQNTVRNAWFNGKPADAKNALVAAAIKAAESWPLDLAPDTLSLCIPIGFSANADPPPQDVTPCTPTYVEGYSPPRLLTKLEELLLNQE